MGRKESNQTNNGPMIIISYEMAYWFYLLTTTLASNMEISHAIKTQGQHYIGPHSIQNILGHYDPVRSFLSQKLPL